MHRIRLLVTLLLATALLAVPAAHSASAGVVVSQVFAGGGNTGASFTNDFVELFNRGTTAVDLTGWTVQYATAAGTSWQVTALSGSIQPEHYYLVQLASSASIGAPLPTPDATGTSNLAVSGGKVAVVHDTAALGCGASAGSCSAISTVADLVGWGSATDYEGTGAAPALGSTTAAVRASGGCTDTDVSSADFSTATPAPRNSSTPAASCGSPPGAESVSQSAAVDIDIQPVLSISLERPAVSFGTAAAGDTPAAISERVTVVSNNATGYALTVHRTAFAPSDLPLGLAASAGGAFAPIPIPPAADLLIGSSAAPSADGGDIWPTSLGFASPLPLVAPGRYTAAVTYTLIGQ